MEWGEVNGSGTSVFYRGIDSLEMIQYLQFDLAEIIWSEDISLTLSNNAECYGFMIYNDKFDCLTGGENVQEPEASAQEVIERKLRNCNTNIYVSVTVMVKDGSGPTAYCCMFKVRKFPAEIQAPDYTGDAHDVQECHTVEFETECDILLPPYMSECIKIVSGNDSIAPYNINVRSTEFNIFQKVWKVCKSDTIKERFDIIRPYIPEIHYSDDISYINNYEYKTEYIKTSVYDDNMNLFLENEINDNDLTGLSGIGSLGSGNYIVIAQINLLVEYKGIDNGVSAYQNEYLHEFCFRLIKD